MTASEKSEKLLYNKKFSKENYLENINNKTILITGANSGIGLALTKKLILLDNTVIATYRENFDNLEKISNTNLSKIKCNLKNINDFSSLDKVLRSHPIQIVFNCAGVFGPSYEDQTIEKLDFDIFQDVIMVNSFSILKIMQIILKNKKSIKNLALLVNISSDAGSLSQNDQGNAYMYRASKSALNSISKNMSVDLFDRFKTVVVAIDPGNVESGMNPKGYLKAEVCANLIVDLLSSDSESLNGKFINLLKEEIEW